MSPLARSLLALVALLAAANAKLPNDYCSDLHMGNETDYNMSFKLTVPGGVVKIPDKCSRPGRKIVGQYLSTCDPPYYTPKIIPLLKGLHYPPNFSKVYIDCPRDVAGCNSLDVDVTQYCELVVPPNQGRH